MPYAPPSGYIEQRPHVDTEPLRSRFHRRRDCPRIVVGATVTASAKPFSAPRCSFCDR